tara:strand:+ start:12 stop:326 length:315 start_codon:yes stop_codon:yes gene_type:complete
MNNIEKKLDALIDALGFDVEENRMPVGDMEISDWDNKSASAHFYGSIPRRQVATIDYKLTKRNTVKKKPKVWIICPLCEGTGVYEYYKCVSTCTHCDGKGKVLK